MSCAADDSTDNVELEGVPHGRYQFGLQCPECLRIMCRIQQMTAATVQEVQSVPHHAMTLP